MNRNPYEFECVGGTAISYVFETTNEIIYQVKFKPTPYLFPEQPDLGKDVFELVIDVIYSQTGKISSDASLPATIAAICENFVSSRERILLYICETSDSRHLARVRKFDAWFRAFSNYHFIKLDANFPDVNKVTYYTSLMFRWDHPQRSLIMDEFNVLASRYNTGK